MTRPRHTERRRCERPLRSLRLAALVCLGVLGLLGFACGGLDPAGSKGTAGRSAAGQVAGGQASDGLASDGLASFGQSAGRPADRLPDTGGTTSTRTGAGPGRPLGRESVAATTRSDPASPDAPRSGGRLFVRQTDEGRSLVWALGDSDLLECSRVRLLDERGGRELRFSGSTTSPDSIELFAEPDPAHAVLVRCEREGDLWRLRVDDRIRTRARVRELALVFDLLERPLGVDAPRTEGGRLVDRSFRAPVVALGFRTGSTALGPSLPLLRRDRRLPWFVGLRAFDDEPILEFGLTVDPPSRLRDDRLVFEAELVGSESLDRTVVMEPLLRRQFRQNAVPMLRGSTAPLPPDDSVRRQWTALRETLDRAVDQGILVEVPIGRVRPLSELLAAVGVLAIDRAAARRQDAVRTLGDLLERLGPTGILPFALDDRGRELRNPSLGFGPTQRDDSASAARLARILLQLRPQVPELSDQLTAAARQAAETLRGAQDENGRLTDRLRPDNGDPEGRPEGLGATTAAAALFATLAREDPSFVEAGRRAVAAIDEALRAGRPISDRLRPDPDPVTGTGQSPWDPDTRAPLIETEALAEALFAATRLGDVQTFERLRTRALASVRAFPPSIAGSMPIGAAGTYVGDPDDDPLATAQLALALVEAGARAPEDRTWSGAVASYRAALLIDGELLRRVRAAFLLAVCNQRYGDVFVDADKRVAVSLEAVWVEQLTFGSAAESIAFDLRSSSPLEPVDVVIRSTVRDTAPSISIGDRTFAEPIQRGQEPGERRLKALPSPVPGVRLEIPGALQRGSTWLAEASGPWDRPNERCELVIFTGDNDSVRIPLAPDGPGHWTAQSPLLLPDDPTLRSIRVQLFVPDGDRFRPNPELPVNVPVGDFQVLQLGEWIPGRTAAEVVVFADGRRRARAVRSDQPLEVDLRVESRAERLLLRCQFAGALRLFADESEIFRSEHEDGRPQEIELELADPRLWLDGRLRLRFEAVDEGQVATIAWQPEGRLSSGSDIARPRRPIGPGTRNSRGLGSVVRIAVVPLWTEDGSNRVEPESLRRAFFGGGDYRQTPGPEVRPTIGSVASFVQTLSGGRTSVVGRVVDPVVVAPMAETSRESLLECWPAILRAVRSSAMPTDNLDAIVVVSGSSTNLTSPRPVLIPGRSLAGPDLAPVPVLWVPDRAADGTFVSTGTLTGHLLSQLSGWPEATGLPDDGDLGLLADGGHVPGAPRAEWMEALGWIDVVTPDAETLSIDMPVRDLSLGPLLSTRRALELPSGSGETFWLSVRGRHEGDARVGRPGLAVCRTWEDQVRPWVFRRDGRSAELRSWWMSSKRSGVDTAFEPMRADDLFREIGSLDEKSDPPFVTLDGTVPWSLDSMVFLDSGTGVDEAGVGGGGSLSFRLERRMRELFELPIRIDRSLAGSSVRAPVPYELDVLGALQVSIPRRLASTTRVRVGLPSTRTGRQRTRFRVRSLGAPVDLQISNLGGETRPFEIGPEPRLFEIDRTATVGGTLELELFGDGHSAEVVIDEWTTTPLAYFEAAISDPADQPILFSDGVVRVGRRFTTKTEGKVSLRVPIVLAPGPALLALRLEVRGAPDFEARLRGLDAGSSGPLIRESKQAGGFRRLIAELPRTDQVQTVFVDLTWTRNTDEDVEVWLADMVVRQAGRSR